MPRLIFPKRQSIASCNFLMWQQLNGEENVDHVEQKEAAEFAGGDVAEAMDTDGDRGGCVDSFVVWHQLQLEQQRQSAAGGLQLQADKVSMAPMKLVRVDAVLKDGEQKDHKMPDQHRPKDEHLAKGGPPLQQEAHQPKNVDRNGGVEEGGEQERGTFILPQHEADHAQVLAVRAHHLVRGDRHPPRIFCQVSIDLHKCERAGRVDYKQWKYQKS